MTLPKVTARYFALEFAGAYEHESGWDGKLWLAWNNHLNELATEGEALIAKEEAE